MIKVMGGSKAWQRFKLKTDDLKRYLQLMDLSMNIAMKQCKSKSDDIKIAEALGSSLQKHMQLNAPNKSIDIKRTFISARNLLHEHAIVEVYGLFTDYLSNIIHEIIKVEPSKFLTLAYVSKDRKIEYNKILELGSYENIQNEMASSIYRALENLRSTHDMLDKIIGVFELEVDDAILNNALVYLRIRHLIIHNNTKADKQFLELSNVENIISINSKNKKLSLNYDVSNNAITSIYKLCKCLDNSLADKGLVSVL